VIRWAGQCALEIGAEHPIDPNMVLAMVAFAKRWSTDRPAHGLGPWPR